MSSDSIHNEMESIGSKLNLIQDNVSFLKEGSKDTEQSIHKLLATLDSMKATLEDIRMEMKKKHEDERKKELEAKQKELQEIERSRELDLSFLIDVLDRPRESTTKLFQACNYDFCKTLLQGCSKYNSKIHIHRDVLANAAHYIQCKNAQK